MKRKEKFPLGLSKPEDFSGIGNKKEAEFSFEKEEMAAIGCVLRKNRKASDILDDVFKERDLLKLNAKGRFVPEIEVAQNMYYKIAKIGLEEMSNSSWDCGHDKRVHQKALADIVEKFQSSMN